MGKVYTPHSWILIALQSCSKWALLGQAEMAFQKEDDFFHTTFSVLMSDADVEVSPLLLQLWVAVVGTRLPILARIA